jgi:hypothetical protein
MSGHFAALFGKKAFEQQLHRTGSTAVIPSE